MGAIQGILGTAAVAYVGSLCTNPLTCGLGTVSLASNLDYANAGFNQMLNGNPQIPLGEQALQNMGMDKDAAALFYMGIGLIPAFTASTAAEYVANLVKHADSALVPVTGKVMITPIREMGGKSVKDVIAATRANVLNNITDNQAARAASNFGTFIQREGKLQESLGIWPPNRGAYGPIENVVLQPGLIIDRFGSTKGAFVSPLGTSFSERALPSESLKAPYHVFEVLQSIPGVSQSKALPRFGQKGQGFQYEFQKSIQWYIDNDYLKVKK